MRAQRAELAVMARRIEEAGRAIGTQAEVAWRLGVSTQQVRRYVSSRSRASAAILRKLAEASGFRFGWLLTGEEPKLAESPGGREAAPSAIQKTRIERELATPRHTALAALEDAREAVLSAGLQVIRAERVARVTRVAADLAHQELIDLYRNEPAFTTHEEHDGYSASIAGAKTRWEEAKRATAEADMRLDLATTKERSASYDLDAALVRSRTPIGDGAQVTGPGPATSEEPRP